MIALKAWFLAGHCVLAMGDIALTHQNTGQVIVERHTMTNLLRLGDHATVFEIGCWTFKSAKPQTPLGAQTLQQNEEQTTTT